MNPTGHEYAPGDRVVILLRKRPYPTLPGTVTEVHRFKSTLDDIVFIQPDYGDSPLAPLGIRISDVWPMP